MVQKRLKNFGIQNPIKEVKSDSTDDTYLLYRKEGRVRCTCPGNARWQNCKHVERYIKEEGKA